jgi:outer membrane protein TolC
VSLDQFTEFAIQNNPSIQQAILNEKVEQQNVNAAISPLLPTAAAAASINDNLILPSTVVPPAFAAVLHTDAVQFGNKYNINPNGTISLNLINAANYEGFFISKKNQQLAGANTRLTIEQIKNSLAQAYYLYLLYQRNYEFAEQDLLNADSLLNITQVRYDNQFIDELDLNRSKSSELQSQNAVDQNKVQLQKALNNLKLLAGLSVSDKIILRDGLEISDQPLADMITTNPLNRPEMQVSMLKVMVNQMALTKQKLLFAPELSVFAAYGVNSYNNNFKFAESSQQWYQNGALGVSLNIPVFSGGIKYFNVQKAKLNQQIATIDMQNTRLKTEKEDQDLLLDYTKAKSDLKVRQKQLFLSERDLRLALVKYKNEAISYDNVINIENELISAQQLLLQAQADYITAQYKIKIINSYDKK